MQIKGNTNNPSILVIGVFHGDEPQGEILINNYLNENKKTSMLFVPRLNNQNSRTNSNGVDLNRNFPTKNWEFTDKNEFFGGNNPASEKETKFIINLVKTYKPKVILTLHAPYKVVNFDGCNDDNLYIVEKISEIMNYPIEPSIGYPTPGSFGTWAGVENNILTITLELDEEIEVEKLKQPVFKVFEYLEGIK